MTTYRTITTNDPEYDLEKDLRNKVLRMPLGLLLSEDDTRGEDEQVHIIALDGKSRVVGCVLVAIYGAAGRVRQMAVEESMRKRGIGGELLQRAEQAAADAGVHTLTLHARYSAKGFYEHRGYHSVSDVFTEVTIPHVSMEKVLKP